VSVRNNRTTKEKTMKTQIERVAGVEGIRWNVIAAGYVQGSIVWDPAAECSFRWEVFAYHGEARGNASNIAAAHAAAEGALLSRLSDEKLAIIALAECAAAAALRPVAGTARGFVAIHDDVDVWGVSDPSKAGGS
jgi:hypothetical protein